MGFEDTSGPERTERILPTPQHPTPNSNRFAESSTQRDDGVLASHPKKREISSYLARGGVAKSAKDPFWGETALSRKLRLTELEHPEDVDDDRRFWNGNANVPRGHGPRPDTHRPRFN